MKIEHLEPESLVVVGEEMVFRLKSLNVTPRANDNNRAIFDVSWPKDNTANLRLSLDDPIVKLPAAGKVTVALPLGGSVRVDKVALFKVIYLSKGHVGLSVILLDESADEQWLQVIDKDLNITIIEESPEHENQLGVIS